MAIYILWLRQLKRFSRKRAAMIGALGQPLIFLLALGFGLSPIYAKAGAGSYIQFLSPGIVGMTILFSAIFTGVEIIWDKQIGFMKEVFVAPVSRFSIMFGKALGTATVSVLQGTAILLITFPVGFRPEHWALLPLALVYMILIAILCASLGTAIAARLDDMQAFPLIINFVIQPLFYLSGAIFPLKNLPTILHWLTRLNPLSYGIDGLRYTLGGGHVFSPILSLSVLAAVTLAVLLFGMYQFSKVEL